MSARKARPSGLEAATRRLVVETRRRDRRREEQAIGDVVRMTCFNAPCWL